VGSSGSAGSVGSSGSAGSVGSSETGLTVFVNSTSTVSSEPISTVCLLNSGVPHWIPSTSGSSTSSKVTSLPAGNSGEFTASPSPPTVKVSVTDSPSASSYVYSTVNSKSARSSSDSKSSESSNNFTTENRPTSGSGSSPVGTFGNSTCSELPSSLTTTWMRSVDSS